MVPWCVGRLGIDALVDQIVDLGDRSGAARPRHKVMSLVSAMVLGADRIAKPARRPSHRPSRPIPALALASPRPASLLSVAR
jgi:hypothetical protein